MNYQHIHGWCQTNGIDYYEFETLNSTQQFLKDKKPLRPTLCIAHHQTHGFGRFSHRHWHSPAGQNLYCSLAWPVSASPFDMIGLNIVLSIIAASKLNQMISKEQAIKMRWPNDLYLDQKKLGGIIVDMISQDDGKTLFIVGFGLNINMTHCDGVENWTSLAQHTQHPWDIEQVSMPLIEDFSHSLSHFSNDLKSQWLAKWPEYCAHQNERVTLDIPNQGLISGESIQITPEGALILKLDSGEEKAFYSGEITKLHIK